MSAPLTLWLPKPPDNANGRKHWSAANKEKRAFWQELSTRALIRRGIPEQPARPLNRVSVLAEWHARHAGHAPDKDNIIRRLKPAIDWLVENGYLAGDSAEHVSWADPIVRLNEPAPILCTVKLTLTPIVK